MVQDDFRLEILEPVAVTRRSKPYLLKQTIYEARRIEGDASATKLVLFQLKDPLGEVSFVDQDTFAGWLNCGVARLV